MVVGGGGGVGNGYVTLFWRRFQRHMAPLKWKRQSERSLPYTPRYTVKNFNEWSPSPAGNPVMVLIKLFLAGNTFGISGFPGFFCSWSGKNPLRQKYSLGSIPISSDQVESEGRQIKQCWIKYYKNKQISPPLKWSIPGQEYGDISGFPAGDRDHSLTFLTVYLVYFLEKEKGVCLKGCVFRKVSAFKPELFL